MKQWTQGDYGWLSVDVLGDARLNAYDKIVLTFVRTLWEMRKKTIVDLPGFPTTAMLCGLAESTAYDALQRLAKHGLVKFHHQRSRRYLVEVLPSALSKPAIEFDWMLCSRHDIKPFDRVLLMDVIQWAHSDSNPSRGKDGRNVSAIAKRCGTDARAIRSAIMNLVRSDLLKLDIVNRTEFRIPCESSRRKIIERPSISMIQSDARRTQLSLEPQPASSMRPALFQPPPDLPDEEPPPLTADPAPAQVQPSQREKELERQRIELERRVADLEQQLAARRPRPATRLWLDTETTGLDAQQHELLEVAIVVEAVAPDGSGEIPHRWSTRIAPERI